MNFEKERLRMVEEQIEARGIRDERVLTAMRKVPRHEFLPEAIRGMAYQDSALPVGEAQTISQPYMVGLMTELLDLKGTERVLEIGTGSGYQAAVLAELCDKVYTVERIKVLADRARLNFDRLGYQGVAIKVYDGTYGWREMAPFDAILVTAGSPDIPAPLVEQLKEGGRMVIPVGERFGQTLLKIVKTPQGPVTERSIPCVFVPLIGNHGWKE
ncbi:MAG TPA: protein-L-isoaspartate(D-aspartate) O-methyltransferase [Nitrospirota bacterium]|nr:protein-L-isoaspartate(D-aspartate) O-methyltransferase [Nitrospirota bacterium]